MPEGSNYSRFRTLMNAVTSANTPAIVIQIIFMLYLFRVAEVSSHIVWETQLLEYSEVVSRWKMEEIDNSAVPIASTEELETEVENQALRTVYSGHSRLLAHVSDKGIDYAVVGEKGLLHRSHVTHETPLLQNIDQSSITISKDGRVRAKLEMNLVRVLFTCFVSNMVIFFAILLGLALTRTPKSGRE
jgi:hypothetical protein